MMGDWNVAERAAVLVAISHVTNGTAIISHSAAVQRKRKESYTTVRECVCLRVSFS
jgi:hypothetical protein